MISLLWFNYWWSLAKITSVHNTLNSVRIRSIQPRLKMSSYPHSGGNDLRLQTIFLLSLYHWRVSLVELENLPIVYLIYGWHFIYVYKMVCMKRSSSVTNSWSRYDTLHSSREYWSVVRRCWKEYFTVNHILSDYGHTLLAWFDF